MGPDAIMNSIVGKSAPLGGLQPFLDTMPRTMTPRQLNDKLNKDGLNGLYNVELDRPSIVGMGPYKSDGVNIQNPGRPADRTRSLTPLPQTPLTNFVPPKIGDFKVREVPLMDPKVYDRVSGFQHSW